MKNKKRLGKLRQIYVKLGAFSTVTSFAFLCLSTTSLAISKKQRIQAIVNNSFPELIDRDEIPEFYKNYFYPSLPPKEKIIFAPQTLNASYVVIPFSRQLNFKSNDYPNYYSYVQVIKNIAPEVNIIFIVKPSDRNNVDYFLGLAKRFRVDHHILNGTVRFVFENFDTLWIRDYGPLFGYSKSGKKYLIDPYYDSRRTFKKTQRGNVLTRIHDDMIPSRFLENLNFNQINKYTVVKPPILLSGGDFFNAGQGLCFTSTNTLKRNGGNQKTVSFIFSQYFGCKHVVYLKPLPGEVTKHIDMFLKIVDKETIILGEYDVISNPNSSVKLLQEQARKILVENKEIVEKTYLNLNRELSIVSMKMPDIYSTKILVSSVFGYHRKHVDVYPTYVNSTVVQSRKGTVIILPRYKKIPGILEMEARRVYREAYGNPKFVFMNSDSLIKSGGAVHCVTTSVPSFPF